MYIETDDIFPNLIKNKKKQQFRLRIFTIHSGAKPEFYKRKILENKIIDYKLVPSGTVLSTEKCADFIRKITDKNYINYEHCKIIVKGDSAKWIVNFADKLFAKYVLDKFHLIRRIRSIFVTTKSSKYKKFSNDFKQYLSKLKSIIKNGTSKTQLVEELNNVYLFFEKNELTDKLKLLIEFLKYFKRNERGIDNYYKEFDASSCTEGQVSSFAKSTLGYGKKIYNEKTFNKILTIKKLKINGYDFYGLLEYDTETKQIENTNYNFETVKSLSAGKVLKKEKNWVKVKSGKILDKYKFRLNS